MGIIPDTIQGKIEFADDHATQWSISPTAIGLTQLEIDALRSLTDETITSRSTAVNSRTVAESATTAQNVKLAELDKRLRQLVKKVVAYAANQSNPDVVYGLAGLPLPKTPQDLPAPLSPTNGSVDLNSGEMALKWDGSLDGGTYFIVERRTVPAGGSYGPWSFVANVQEKKFTDQNVPVGFAAIDYRIRAFRNKLESTNALLVSVPLGAAGTVTSQQIASPGTPVGELAQAA